MIAFKKNSFFIILIYLYNKFGSREVVRFPYFFMTLVKQNPDVFCYDNRI